MTKDRPSAAVRWLVTLAIILLSLGALRSLSNSASLPTSVAAPHVISSSNHPFDPDWLLVQEILEQKCVACHRGNIEDRYDLSSYEALMKAGQPDEGEDKDDAMIAVVPGDCESSVLWEKVQWNAECEKDSDLDDRPEMPEDKLEWLTKSQIETIERWINNGALEYRLPPTCNIRPLLESDFPSAKECKACHPKQYTEWSRSMHHYAQHSPIYMAFNLTLQERTGGTLGTFCSRCHTAIGTSLGENALRRNVNRSQISMEGVTCIVCHRRTNPAHKTNGRDYIQPGKMLDTCMYGPFEGAVTPEGNHKSQKNPYIKSSNFCGSCHDVTSPGGVRLEEAFSEWQNSPAAKQGISCQQCHMGPVQGVATRDCDRPLGRAAKVPGVDDKLIPLRPLANHTFSGPDYSVLPDTEFPHKLDWMYEKDYRDTKNLTPYQIKTLETLRRRNRKELNIAKKMRIELLQRSASMKLTAPKNARPGESIKLRVDVKSLVSGHSFPTGFTAERQLWVDIKVCDPLGREIFHSGNLDTNGDLRDSHSHAVEAGKVPHDKYLLHFQNRFISLTQKGTERAVILALNRHVAPLSFTRPATGPSMSFGRPPVLRIAKGSLPPLGTIGKNFPVLLPKLCGDYTVDAVLNFRNLPPNLLDEIGVPHLKHLLEVVPITSCRRVIRVGVLTTEMSSKSLPGYRIYSPRR